MEPNTKEYLINLGLTFCMVIGLGVGSMFMLLGLIERQNILYFIIGFILVIIGMLGTVLLFSDK